MKWVSLLKRALCALFATAIGIGVGTALNLVLMSVLEHKSVPAVREFLVAYAQFLTVTAFAGYPGWIAGFVVLVPFAGTRSWRFWMWLGVGTLIGVLSILFRTGWPRGGLMQSGFGTFYAWAAIDAGLTTLGFLLLARLTHSENVLGSSPAAPK